MGRRALAAGLRCVETTSVRGYVDGVRWVPDGAGRYVPDVDDPATQGVIAAQLRERGEVQVTLDLSLIHISEPTRH